MVTTTQHTRVCEFCGKEIHYKCVEEDGRDWHGHQRGTSKSYKVGFECTCNKTQCKKMCVNCKHYNLTCISEKHLFKINNSLKEYSDLVVLPKITFLKVKDITKCCEFWELKEEIAKQVFK